MNKQRVLLLAILAVVSLAFAFLMPNDESMKLANDMELNGIIPQKYIRKNLEEKEVLNIYYKEELLGIVHDLDEYEAFLNRIYIEKYAEEFPDTEVGLGEDIHVSKSLSYFEVEDKDEEIFEYLESNNFFSIMGYRIEFSNGAVTYVKDSEDFIKARKDFVLNFLESEGVDPSKTLKAIDSGQKPNVFSSLGLLDLGYKYVDTAKISNVLVPIDLMLRDYNECIQWLSFGYNYKPSYYTVEEGDTLQGVAAKKGVSTTNLVSVNADKIKSENQVLQVGEKLNVTEIKSPIKLEVTKQRVSIEPDYPKDTKYEYDPTLREGQRYVKQSYKVGKYRVMYNETFVNGVLDPKRSKEVSRLQLEFPQQEIVVIGTMVLPSVGSGSFRYPTDNAEVTCGWGCYAGHAALDIVNRYNRYGPVRAADRGRVYETGYTGINGYYIIINHNNGLYTYYGHMNRPAYVGAGVVVGKGEVIGQIGETGLAFGAHIHFEIRTSPSYGSSVYPWPYLGG